MPADWVFAAIAALLLVHVIVVATAIRYGGGHPPRQVTHQPHSESRSEASADTEASGHHADGTVTCPDCGEPNEAEYRYCRQCVSELPTGVSFVTTRSHGRSRE